MHSKGEIFLAWDKVDFGCIQEEMMIDLKALASTIQTIVR